MDRTDKVILTSYIDDVIKSNDDKKRAYAMGFIMGYSVASDTIKLTTHCDALTALSCFLNGDKDGLKTALNKFMEA